MSLFFSIPYIFRIFITLILLLVIYKYAKNLLIALIICIFLLAFWTGHSIDTFFNTSWQRISSINNIFLIIIIAQIMSLSQQMKDTGVMKDLVNSIKAKVPVKISMALLPAIIGLLPMPGGALFSAPLVADMDRNRHFPGHLKTKINYWFRHIWETWWPLYPGVLLAIEISGLRIDHFVLIQFPMTFFVILAGYIFILKKLKISNNTMTDDVGAKQVSLPILLSPIIIVVSVTLAIRLLLPQMASFNKYTPMLIAILIAQIYLQFIRPLDLKTWRKIVFRKNMLNLLLIVLMVRVYGAFIESEIESGILLMNQVKSELADIHLSPLFIIMLLPFVSGLATGIAIGFVGASFPIVLNLLGNDPLNSQLYAATVLAYGFGYVGMMLSPVHICHLVTNDYFKTNLVKSILDLLKPSLIVLAGSFLLSRVWLFILS